MTLPQILAFTILAGMMGLFVWGRIRYDLVAVLALLAAVLVGIVPADKAFTGFSDDIVIIVASALLVSAAVAKSGILEAALSRLAPYIATTQAQIVVLVTTVTVLSAFVKNIGALAMMIPVLVLAGAMGLVAFNVLPVAVAFFAAAVVLILARSLSLREAYAVIEWPILIMLGALIPVSEAVRTTGGTDLIAGWLSAAAALLPATGALVLIMVAAMAVTPFLNNAATVLVMAPIAASFAGQLGYRPDAFLMAVAIGAACDFLTPIGHQCNTLVMGPGGYRFGDYWRLGLPLSLIVLAVGTPMVALVWPLRPG
jgi:di/tricarboxylate transporter